MPRPVRWLLLVGIVLLLAAWLCWRQHWLDDGLLGILTGMGTGLLFSGLFKWRVPDACDSSTPQLRRRYLREFLPPMAVYVAAVFASVWLLKRVDALPLRALVALLPLPPVALALRAIMRYIRDADELQRQIELEAVSFTTAVISLLYLAGGFLQMAKVIDIDAGDAMFWVFPLVCIGYGLTKIVVHRRYR
jgi:hypothetical protein